MYADMDLVQFIHRLLDKRAASFYGPNDRWKLLDNKSGFDGWEDVGTDNEKEPLVSTWRHLNQVILSKKITIRII